MTPQELRNSILQLAIQGKLVEQRPEEGTGEEIYQEIQKEKEALINAGKIKKFNAPSEIAEDEIPFDIPSSWKWARLGKCGCLVRGSGIKRAETVPKGLPCVRYGQLYTTFKTSFSTAVSFIPKDLFDRCQKVHHNDILMALTGENNIDIAMAVAYEGTEEIAMGGDMTKFSNHLMNPLFLVSVINSPYGISCKSKLATGNIIVHISNDKLASIPIPLPPLAEQKRIVGKIEELMPLVDQYEEAWNRLEELKKRFPKDLQKSVLQYAVQGKLVEQRPEDGTGEEVYKSIQFEKSIRIKKGISKKTKAFPSVTDDTYIYEMPNTWKKCYLGEIAFVTKLAGFEYTDYVAPSLGPIGIPLIKGKNVQDGRIVFEFESFIPEKVSDQLPRSQIRNKCLLTPYVGTIGNIALFNEPFRAHLGSNVGKIELINGEKQLVLEEYVLFYLRSAIGYSELSKSKKATAQESISIGAIRNVIIPIPPTAEQKRIVKKVEEIMPLVNQCAIT